MEEIPSNAGLDVCEPSTTTRLWNCDETAFSTVVAASKLLA